MTQPIQRSHGWCTMHQLRRNKPQPEKAYDPASTTRPWMAHDASTQNETSHSPRRRMTQPMQRGPGWRTMHQLRMKKAIAREGA
jgi:hypothetical protein